MERAPQDSAAIQMVDGATGWSERLVVLGRGQAARQATFGQLLAQLPFEIGELHPDKGREVFNAHLVRFCKEKVVGVTLWGSRPAHKNAHRLLEQQNASLVRQYFGHLPLDTDPQVQAANELDEQMWLSYHLFQPLLPLKEKPMEGDTVRRKWDQAQTPEDRLLAAGGLSQEQQVPLQGRDAHSHPLALREAIDEGLRARGQQLACPDDRPAWQQAIEKGGSRLQ